MNLEVVVIEQFPCFTARCRQGNETILMAAYLQRLLKQHHVSELHGVQLPSLAELAAFFHSTPLKIHDVLQVLRSRGYDYQFYSMDAPIPFRLLSLPGFFGNGRHASP